MENITCKYCGGTATKEGDYYVCKNCLKQWEVEELENEQVSNENTASEEKEVVENEEAQTKVSGKRSKSLSNILSTQELGDGTDLHDTEEEKNGLEEVSNYIKARKWQKAETLIDSILFNNPSLGKAIWYKLQIKFCVLTEKELFTCLPNFEKEDYKVLASAIKCSSKAQAKRVLNALYEESKNIEEETSLLLLNTILKFNYDDKVENVKDLIENSIEKNRFEVFKLLLSALGEISEEEYVDYNIRYAKSTNKIEDTMYCINNVITIDDGNVKALTILLNHYLKQKNRERVISTYNKILKSVSSSNVNSTAASVLDQVKNSISTKEDASILKELVDNYPGDFKEIKDILLSIAFAVIKQGLFNDGKYFLSLVKNIDENNPEVYWGYCLAKTRSTDEKALIRSKILLKKIPEYNVYLSLASAFQKEKRMEIANEQVKYNKKKRTKKALTTFICSFLVLLVAFVIVGYFVYVPILKRNEFMANRQYGEVVKMDNLSEFTIPDDVYSIDSNVFYECTSLTKVVIPYGVHSIGANAFFGCTSLTTVTIPSSVTTISASAFEGCTSLESINIPSGVTIIEDSVFYGCSSLNSITIPNTVTTIEGYAFFGCSSLRSLTIPNSVNSIGSSAFGNCSSLQSIRLPFAGDREDSSLNPHFGYVFGANTYTENNEFVPSSLEQVFISRGTKIGYCAFYGCDSIKYVNLPTTITQISDDAFYNCSSLEEIEIPNSTSSIGAWAFYNNTSLKYVVIPTSVTQIGNSAFGNCPIETATVSTFALAHLPKGELKTVTVTGGVQNDYSTANDSVYPFQYQNGVLTSTNKSHSTTSSYVITARSNATITFSYKVSSEGSYDFLKIIKNGNVLRQVAGSTSYTSFSVTLSAGDTLTFKYDKDGSNSVGDDTAYIKDIYINGKLMGAENLNVVGAIADGAFINCAKLTNVTIGKFVSEIGNNAFYNCTELESITFVQDSVISKIGANAFFGCSSLTSITIPSTVTNVGAKAFNNCINLENIDCQFESMPSGWDNSWKGNCPGEITWLNHVHEYDQAIVSNDFLATESTCEEKATYYYSCTCGEIGTETFEYGNYGEHNYEVCCIENQYLAAEATCSEKATYYYSCACGKKGTDTFEYGNYAEHDWEEEYSSNLTHHWLNCANCTATLEEEHNFINEVCTACNYNKVGTEGVLYANYGTYAVVVGYEGTATEVIIANEYQGVPVTGIGDEAFSHCASLNGIVIPSSISSIGNWVFSNCTALKSIVIPNSVTSIGSYAFSDCYSLTSVTIGSGVTSIGFCVFFYCTSLISVEIPDSVTSIGEHAFYMCTSLSNIVMPNSVTSINHYAFGVCFSLTSIVIPNSVTSIGEGAFSNCSDLTIYYEGSSIPSGWSSNFNPGNRPIVYNYNSEN